MLDTHKTDRHECRAMLFEKPKPKPEKKKKEEKLVEMTSPPPVSKLKTNMIYFPSVLDIYPFPNISISLALPV